MMAQSGTDKKPTVVFLARFFSEGLVRRWPLRGNGLQRGKSPKTGKTQKKVENNFRGTPVFLQKGPVFRPKTGLLGTHGLYVADFQRFPIKPEQEATEETERILRKEGENEREMDWKASEPRTTRNTRTTRTCSHISDGSRSNELRRRGMGWGKASAKRTLRSGMVGKSLVSSLVRSWKIEQPGFLILTKLIAIMV
jgi:hypothetical protein